MNEILDTFFVLLRRILRIRLRPRQRFCAVRSLVLVIAFYHFFFPFFYLRYFLFIALRSYWQDINRRAILFYSDNKRNKILRFLFIKYWWMKFWTLFFYSSEEFSPFFYLRYFLFLALRSYWQDTSRYYIGIRFWGFFLIIKYWWMKFWMFFFYSLKEF